MSLQTKQQGGSAIGLIVFLAIFAYGVFVAIQYVPQHIEYNAVKTILESIEEKNRLEPMVTGGAVQSAVDNQLYINEMADLKDSFKVTQKGANFVISVAYVRELNLLYETKQMNYEKTVTLK